MSIHEVLFSLALLTDYTVIYKAILVERHLLISLHSTGSQNIHYFNIHFSPQSKLTTDKNPKSYLFAMNHKIKL